CAFRPRLSTRSAMWRTCSAEAPFSMTTIIANNSRKPVNSGGMAVMGSSLVPQPEKAARANCQQKSPGRPGRSSGLGFAVYFGELPAHLQRPRGRAGKVKPPEVANRPSHVCYYARQPRSCKHGLMNVEKVAWGGLTSYVVHEFP